MSRRVYAPCEVEHDDVSEAAGYPVSVPEVVSPQSANEAGEDKAHKQSEPRVCFGKYAVRRQGWRVEQLNALQ